MNQKAAVMLLSTGAMLSFIGCLCLGSAFVASGMEDVRYLSATILCLLWSYLSSSRAQEFMPPAG